MNEGVAVAALLGLPALAVALVIARHGWKARAREKFRAGVRRLLASIGAEEAGPGRFAWRGRVYRWSAGLNPLFGPAFELRLSTFGDRAIEFEIRRAANVPRPLPPELREIAAFEGCALEAPSPADAVRHLLAARPVLERVFPARWEAYARLATEVVLSRNRGGWDEATLPADLETLAGLARIDVEQDPRGGIYTFRAGFEPDVAAWHWKPEQRAGLPEAARRWAVSCWKHNAYLNPPLARLFSILAGGDAGLWITAARDLGFLEEGFGRPVGRDGNVVTLPDPRMAIAADQFLDGEFFSAFVAAEPSAAPEVTARFRTEHKVRFHDAALDVLESVRFVARRLYDDEFAWFSGEYEILSARLEEADVRAALQKVAGEFGATVHEIDRPFSFKLLKEDRLEGGF